MHCTEMAALAMHTAVRQYRCTAKGETSSMVHCFDNARIVAKLLNRLLAEAYSFYCDI